MYNEKLKSIAAQVPETESELVFEKLGEIEYKDLLHCPTEIEKSQVHSVYFYVIGLGTIILILIIGVSYG